MNGLQRLIIIAIISLDVPEDRRTILTVPLLIAESGYYLNQDDFESAEATLKKYVLDHDSITR